MQIRFTYDYVLCRSFQSSERDLRKIVQNILYIDIWGVICQWVKPLVSIIGVTFIVEINHFRSDKSQQIPIFLTITRPTIVYYIVVLIFGIIWKQNNRPSCQWKLCRLQSETETDTIPYRQCIDEFVGVLFVKNGCRISWKR